MNSRSRPRPLVLCILDGWGERPKADDNAIETARTPVWHQLMARWPHAHLQASEHYVGLPDGQMGNSEVGHTNMGAGRVVFQDLPRIDAAIAEGDQKSGVSDRFHFREKPLRVERFSGPDTAPASRRNARRSDFLAFSSSSRMMRPRGKPVFRAVSVSH